MATVKLLNNILSEEMKVFSVNEGVTVESIIKESVDENIYSGTLVECYDLETGKTYFAPLEESDDTINAIILVNNKDVGLSYEVKENDIVSIIITPASGGSGSGWSWTGAVVGGLVGAFEGALVGTTYGGLGWGTAIGAIIGGVVGFVAGGIIGGQIDQKKKLDDTSGAAGLNSERLADVRGATNQPLLDQPFPVVLGKHLTAPFVVGSPYNDISGQHGEDNYIHVLYCVGYAPLRITDIKLGEQFLAHNQSWSGNANLKNIWCGSLHGTDPNPGSGTDVGEIVNTWKNNDVTVEILQQIPDDDVYYGSVYPYAKIQRDIDANVLYIADGTIAEIAKGENISYKGMGLQNGLRNNPIRLSEQFPKSLKVELDFPQGLYKTRSETHSSKSKPYYYKIPMWVAIQWRVYSDDNDKADGENAGTLNLPTYNYSKHKYNLINGKAKRGWNSFRALNTVSVGWKSSYENAVIDAGISYVNSIFYTSFFHIGTITSNVSMNTSFTVDVSYKPHQQSTVHKTYTYPANTTSFVIDEDFSFYSFNPSVTVTVTPNSSGFKSASTEITPTNYWGGGLLFVGIRNNISVYNATNRTLDIAAHTGNTLPDTINSGWLNAEAFNLFDLGGTNEDKDGINEFRCVTEVDLLDWAEQNLRANGDSDEEFVNKVKSYFFDSSNSTKSIEVRVVRISPNYLDETISREDYSAFKFYDIFTWKTLSSTLLDGNELMDNSRLIQKRPLPEDDMRKLCIIALSAKTDNTDQLSNTVKKLSCIAESFAPYYDDTTKKWVPENIKTKNNYYRYEAVAGKDVWVPITEQEYYQDRQTGYTYKGVKSKCVPGGNDYLERIISDGINTTEHRDSADRVYLPENDDVLKFCNNNVASVFLLSGIGPHLGNDALGYIQSDFENNGIGDFNIDSLTKWYKWAEDVTDGSTYNSNGYHIDHNGNRVEHNANDLVHIYFTANAYVYATQLLENLFSNIAIAGRAVYTRDNRNRLCVVVDKPENYPVALINQQNTLKSSYTLTYAELPSGIQITFSDEDDGYIQNQLYCMTDGEDSANPHGAIEPYSFRFVTNNYQAWSLGRYLLANRVLNKEVVTKQLGIEGASLGLGDLVLVQDDTMLIGTDSGGRITQLIEDNSSIYGFIINESYHFTGETESGSQLSNQGVIIMQPTQYGEYRVITLRLAAVNTQITVDGVLYKQTKGNTNVVLFDTAIDKSQYSQSGNDYYVYKPEAGNLVGFGILGKVTSTYRIIKIKPAEKNKYDFTLMKYQENLYNYGAVLPSFQNNMTTPDRSQEDSFAINYNASQQDLINSIASATDQAQGIIDSNFSKVPPVPSNLTVTVDRDKLHMSCVITGDGINNIDYILYEIKRHDNTTKQVKGKYTEDSFFDRTVDGYPEYSDLSQWQIRAKAVSLYTNEEHEKIASDWSSYENITTASLNVYGTWHIPNISAVKQVVDRTVIISAIYTGSQQRTLYGTPITKVKIRRVGNLDCEENLVGVVEVTEVPQNPNVGDIIHYLGQNIEEGGVIVFKHGDYYEYTNQNEWVKAGRTFNEVLGIEEDPLDGEGNPIYYTPDFDRSVQYSENADNEPHYKLNSTDSSELGSNKLTHTLPLIGQTSRIFKSGDIFTETFTKDVTDYSTMPQNPHEGDIVHYVGETTYQGTEPEYIKDAYYLYENSEWQLVYAKVLMVPTTYEYSLQQTNESGYSTNECIVQITALNTNISDIVHSHEHYKELYVEKLSAISANMGMIRQGGMGDFASDTNCWALSDLSPEDSGVAEGIMKGTFRVGDDKEYFRVTPHKKADGTRYYTIELKAGNIELTSDLEGQDSIIGFAKGTYVYNDARTSRMALRPDGIIVQTYSGNPTTDRDWTLHPELVSDISKVYADEKGNMIISNTTSDAVPSFGYTTSGTIYHFDDYDYPTNEEVIGGQSPSNPMNIACTGSVQPAALKNPLIESETCFSGTVSKTDMSGFTGNIVFFNKADKVVTSGKGINVDGTVETALAPLTGYNEAMRENSTVDPSEKVGAYLGLTAAQIEQGIFY